MQMVIICAGALNLETHEELLYIAFILYIIKHVSKFALHFQKINKE